MSFFNANLDYIYFIYGLAFMVLAAVCFSHARADRSAMAWDWLALFGLTHGINEWLDCASLNLGHPSYLLPSRLALLLTSFACLMEFGRASTHFRRRWRPGAYLYCYLLPVFGLWFWCDWTTTSALCRYLLAFPAALWAALAFLQASRRTHAPQCHLFRLAAGATAVYAVASGLIVSPAAIPPASILNADTFQAFAHFPVPLLRGTLALVIAGSVWRYFDLLPSGPKEQETEGGRRRRSYPWFAALVVISVLGWLATHRTAAIRDSECRQDLMSLASAVAAMLNPEDIKQLAGTPEDVENPVYARLKLRLEHVKATTYAVRYVYLMRARGEALYFAVDAEPPGAPGFSPPGEAYNETTPAAFSVLAGRQGLVEGPVTDRWGTWISAMAPVWSAADHRAVAILGMDIDYRDWRADINRKRLLVILICQMACIALLVAFAGFHFNRLATARLASSERRFRAIFDSANDAITIHELSSGDTIEANRRAYELVGYPPGAVPVADITPFTAGDPPFDSLHADTFVRQAAAGVPQVFEWHLHHRDGSRLWVEVNLKKALVGNRDRLIAVVRDIHERKAAEELLRNSRDELDRRVQERTAELAQANAQLQADVAARQTIEAELRDSEARFRALAETESTGIVILQGNNYIYANPGALKITGYSWDEASRMAFWERITPDFREAIRLCGQARRRGEAVPSQYNFKIIAKNGEEKWVFCSVGVITYGGQPAVIATFIDITEHKHLEQERETLALRTLQSRNLESLGAMAGGIAHDFNNLLMTILGNADLVLQGLPANSALLPFLEDIRSAGRRASGIADNMLVYSGRGKFMGENLDLGAFLRSLGPFLSTLTSTKIDVVFDAPEQLPVINANPNQVRQAIMNLVTNAVEAIGEGSGQIRVGAGTEQLSREQIAAMRLGERLSGGAFVFLQVEDTGVGMDASTVARVFDPFFSTKFIGRGLGLPAVHGIVKSHGGAIQVRSAPDKGTCIHLVFPVLSAAAPLTPGSAAAAATPPDVGTSTPPATAPETVRTEPRNTILVVDDEETILRLTQSFLERAGYRVLTAADGASGLELFNRHAASIDLVLLDFSMPGMNGEEVLVAIRRTHPSIPVILSSGYPEKDVVGGIDTRAFSGFIKKPYRSQTLVHKIQQVVGTRPGTA